MKRKIKRILGYTIYTLLGNAICAYSLYTIVMALASVSPLLAYAGNLVMIIFLLAIDEYSLRRGLRAEILYDNIRSMKSRRGRLIVASFFRWSLEYYMTFKTFLLIFYIAVMLFSQIIKLNPGLVGEDITVFISTIDYSVLILVAFTDFREQFSKDKSRAKARLDELNEYLAEHGMDA